ncbi:MAG: hypothetical protein AB7S26_38460 [Sandaracinaceae bacterium]
MLRRAPVPAVSLAALVLFGCDVGGVVDGGPSGMDGARPDTGAPMVDSGPRTCSGDPDCDDGFPCTIDSCVVGNVCEYTPIDARCNAGERCVVGFGCRMGGGSCTTNAECDDGDVCTGTEMCLAGSCFDGRPHDCSDGNACTTDICDQTLVGLCRYELAAGCDGGGVIADAGPPCDAFDPATDFTGTYSLLPGQACDAGLGSGYNVSAVSFTLSSGTLTVQAGPFTLTQSPAPTTGMFDVSGGNGCASIRLTGEFMCRGRFRGTWMSTHAGTCATRCTNANTTVVGL